jgi:hypothetical protein
MSPLNQQYIRKNLWYNVWASSERCAQTTEPLLLSLCWTPHLCLSWINLSHTGDEETTLVTYCHHQVNSRKLKKWHPKWVEYHESTLIDWSKQWHIKDNRLFIIETIQVNLSNFLTKFLVNRQFSSFHKSENVNMRTWIDTGPLIMSSSWWNTSSSTVR